MIAAVHLCDRHNNLDPLDDRFSMTFTTSSGRCLRIRLPLHEMTQIAHGILGMAHERAWREEPLRWRNEP
jgi:hypothetical protein